MLRICKIWLTVLIFGAAPFLPATNNRQYDSSCCQSMTICCQTPKDNNKHPAKTDEQTTGCPCSMMQQVNFEDVDSDEFVTSGKTKWNDSLTINAISFPHTAINYNIISWSYHIFKMEKLFVTPLRI